MKKSRRSSKYPFWLLGEPHLFAQPLPAFGLPSRQVDHRLSQFVPPKEKSGVSVELSRAAVEDLNNFSPAEIDEIYELLLSLTENPRPTGAQILLVPQATAGISYLGKTIHFNVYYEIRGNSRVRVVAVFRKSSLN